MKWFDANGTDIDAYPERAFQGGVYAQQPEQFHYTEAQLLEKGLVENHRMWISDGWFYCRTCANYRDHFAMSHKGQADCYAVCRHCRTYTGQSKA